jgi:hypothetical protein
VSIVLVGQFIGQLPCSCAIVPSASFGQLIDREKDILAPQVGLEPTTLRLTAECSAIELLRSGSGYTLCYC